jgi:hypothetical protein
LVAVALPPAPPAVPDCPGAEPFVPFVPAPPLFVTSDAIAGTAAANDRTKVIAVKVKFRLNRVHFASFALVSK